MQRVGGDGAEERGQQADPKEEVSDQIQLLPQPGQAVAEVFLQVQRGGVLPELPAGHERLVRSLQGRCGPSCRVHDQVHLGGRVRDRRLLERPVPQDQEQLSLAALPGRLIVQPARLFQTHPAVGGQGQAIQRPAGLQPQRDPPLQVLLLPVDFLSGVGGNRAGLPVAAGGLSVLNGPQ